MSKFKIRVLCAAFAAGMMGSLVATPALAAEKDSRVIVKFKAGAFAKGRAEVVARGGRAMQSLSEFNAMAVRLSPAAVKLLKGSASVEYIEPDYPQYPMAEVTPYGISLVQADQVTDGAAGNRTLCIIDSGIDGTHPDHAGNLLSGENLTTSGFWNTDESGHGTHVAGTVAAVGSNGIGVVGVMPNKKINLYIAKVFDASGSTSSFTVAKAMWGCYKRGGANVISMSLGGAGASKLQGTVATALAKRGVMMFAAAGNGGTADVSYPAGFDEVISVAAVDANSAHASFSQFNADVEIAAPGVAVLSTIPQALALESQVTVAGTSYASLPMDGSPTLSATAPLADFGLGDTVVPGGMAGKTCLISRGTISFADKVLNCQASGGMGAIIYNNTTGALAGTLSGTVTAIPSVGITQADGATLMTQLGASATVAIVPSAYPYAEFNGTSMATPHASAVAALVWSQKLGCTAAEIRATLQKSAVDLGAVGRDVQFGYGLIQAQAAVARIDALGCGN